VIPVTPLKLPNFKETGTDFFLKRREIGIINIGYPGLITVDGQRHALGRLDCLYAGRGVRDLVFESGSDGPSAFYFVSTPAHATYPTVNASRETATILELGDSGSANRRRIVQYIHEKGIQSCQLVMGFTELEPGSVWNTMPPHTHDRRTEVYFYFDIADQVVIHLMGLPSNTRHLVVRDREAVLSPPWSIHTGAGTRNYRFIWSMGGDNQVFSDMDAASLDALR
jgi:4-deoxy-L-threo-5-hexosulose-uronate ketol-isomerase